MAKVPTPRQLTAHETLDTLAHWKSHVRNYIKQTDDYKFVFLRSTTWDASIVNYGFTGDEAEHKADCVESVLDTLVGFMPGPFLTADITLNSKCMEDVFKVIWDHYEADPSPLTFL